MLLTIGSILNGTAASLVSAPPAPQSQPVAQSNLASVVPVVENFKEQLLLVDINQQQLNETVLLLEDRAGALYLSSQDLQRWRLRQPDTKLAFQYRGDTYFPLKAIAYVSHLYDPKQLSLMIAVRPEAFVETTLVQRGAAIPLSVKSGPGGFINYELFAAYSPDATQHSAQFELGYFNRFGVGTGNVFIDHFSSHPKVTRLDSTWTIDYPERMQSLRLGDAINVPGIWGRSVRFGGVQYGTNFGTRPSFDTFPSQRVVGQAALPSTVDVFVNNALVSSQNVPPGPFSIRNLPGVTGAGEVQLVVRDLFGREQLVTRPFYYSQSLLREGLEAFSYEFGVLRENFGINSNDYSGWLASGTYRRGLNERFTGEAHGEAMSKQTTIGAGGDYLALPFGTLHAYLAGSRASRTATSGAMILLGIDRQAQPWSLGARMQLASRNFTQVGQPETQLAPIQISSMNLSYLAGRGGAIGAAYAMQHNRERTDFRVASLSYSVSLGPIGSLTLSALRNLSDDRSTTIFVMLNIPLSSSTSLSVSALSMRGGSGDNSNDFTTTLQSNLPMGEGSGYRLVARNDRSKEASYTFQNNIGTYSADVAQAQGATSTRFGVSGGVAVLDNNAFLSRRIDQSFAVARIPDYPNVRILTDNQPAGRTDAGGNALIPRLRAYDRNVISIDQRDLPMDAEIGLTKLEAVPYFRSGIDMRFPIKHSRGATLTILLEDGKPLPVGALVQRIGQDEVFIVGYGGQAYVAGLAASTRLRATWITQSCEFEVRFTVSNDPLPDLGTFTCKGVGP